MFSMLMLFLVLFEMAPKDTPIVAGGGAQADHAPKDTPIVIIGS
jgi:hypothetical protein